MEQLCATQASPSHEVPGPQGPGRRTAAPVVDPPVVAPEDEPPPELAEPAEPWPLTETDRQPLPVRTANASKRRKASSSLEPASEHDTPGTLNQGHHQSDPAFGKIKGMRRSRARHWGPLVGHGALPRPDSGGAPELLEPHLPAEEEVE
jgi:hypothetical protein